jgi:xylulokinase
VLTSDRGEILAEHSATFDVLTPWPAWAEQWPDLWLDGLSRAVRGLVEKAGVDTTQVHGMAVSSL